MKFLSALIPALMTGLGTLLGKVIAAFGFSIVTYVGLESLISGFKDKISASVHGVPAGLLQMFYISGGGVVLNIFLLSFHRHSLFFPFHFFHKFCKFQLVFSWR